MRGCHAVAAALLAAASTWARGDELFYAYMVDNQAIVIPDTIDAIRALTGLATKSDDSIAQTNDALGVSAKFY